MCVIPAEYQTDWNHRTWGLLFAPHTRLTLPESIKTCRTSIILGINFPGQVNVLWLLVLFLRIPYA